jgi:hypothetical protein
MKNPIDMIEILIRGIEKSKLINIWAHILRYAQNRSPSLFGFVYITRRPNRGGGHGKTRRSSCRTR